MAAHGRVGTGRNGRTIAVAAVMLGLAFGSVSAQDREEIRRRQRPEPAFAPMSSETMRSDAELTDVCFVNPERGWAVGDRGTIWYTEDGGRRWALQESGVSCRLESVCFINPETGWAAGWTAQPYLQTGAGVLLWTRDGGQHWTQDAKLLLPALKRVRFVNPRTGWAIGSPSALCPSGVLISESAGRSWEAVPGERSPGWGAGDFLGSQIAAVAGGGVAVVVRGGQINLAETPDLSLRSASRIRFFGPQTGWLVGPGGLLLQSDGQGAVWQPPANNVPEETARQFDFSALEVRGPRCWIAGSPGTRVFHTPDGGQRWFVSNTGQQLPLNALAFADDQRGWAVGHLGTILATHDGGQTWRVQRAGGRRTALLGIFAEPEHVPLELYAKLSGNDGYLGVIEVVHRRDLDGPLREEIPRNDLLREAASRVGASAARTAWQFPLPQPGVELSESAAMARWNRWHRGRGREELEAHLVRLIRTWRPDVLVTQQGALRGGDALGRSLNDAVLQAVSQAANSAAQVEQIQQAGLAPWQVRRLYGALTPGAQGSISVSAGQLAERLARPLDDVASEARGMLQRRLTAQPALFGFQELLDQTAAGSDRRDFFNGLGLTPGGEARRAVLEPGAETLDLVRRIIQKRRAIQTITEQTHNDSGGGLLNRLGEFTGGLDPYHAGDLLFHLGQLQFQAGQWATAAEAFEQLIQRSPTHPLAPPASAWLVAYYASSETAHRVRPTPRDSLQQATVVSVRSLQDAAGRLEQATLLASRIQQTRPELFAQPWIGFPLAAAHRRRGEAREAESFYTARARSAPRDAWWACAQGEQWLVDPKGHAPKPMLRCSAAPTKPRLDGRLGDPAWHDAQAADLRGLAQDDAPWPTQVMLAHDEQFLYVAIRARKAPGIRYDSAAGTRQRDADLSQRDRVEIFLDIDRDYTTYYHLTIDYRGWTAEDCWGDSRWNPKWFVSASNAENEWAVEAAIPLDQFAEVAPPAGTAWAIGIQRTAPGVGFQSWNTPAAPEVRPEGFGYLIFQ